MICGGIVCNISETNDQRMQAHFVDSSPLTKKNPPSIIRISTNGRNYIAPYVPVYLKSGGNEMKKRTLAMLLAACMTAGMLTACGGTSTSTTL